MALLCRCSPSRSRVLFACFFWKAAFAERDRSQPMVPSSSFVSHSQPSFGSSGVEKKAWMFAPIVPGNSSFVEVNSHRFSRMMPPGNFTASELAIAGNQGQVGVAAESPLQQGFGTMHEGIRQTRNSAMNLQEDMNNVVDRYHEFESFINKVDEQKEVTTRAVQGHINLMQSNSASAFEGLRKERGDRYGYIPEESKWNFDVSKLKRVPVNPDEGKWDAFKQIIALRNTAVNATPPSIPGVNLLPYDIRRREDMVEDPFL